MVSAVVRGNEVNERLSSQRSDIERLKLAMFKIFWDVFIHGELEIVGDYWGLSVLEAE